MAKSLTVNDMIDQTRDQIDEESQIAITDADILQALNRGQTFAADIMARNYPDPLIKTETITSVSGQQAYEMPEDSFEERVLGVEVQIGNVLRPLTRVSYDDLHSFLGGSVTGIPEFYAIIGSKIHAVPITNGTNDFKVWYVEEPEPHVVSQGRISTLDVANNYVRVVGIGPDVTTVGTDLNNYINIVDGTTGLVKATLQVAGVAGNKVTFKTVHDATRDTVNGKDVLDAIPATVELDDYICTIHGSCIPRLRKPFMSFEIEFAALEIKRRLGESISEDLGALMAKGEQVERTWVGRENTLRIEKRNRHWGLPGKFWGRGN